MCKFKYRKYKKTQPEYIMLLKIYYASIYYHECVSSITY